MSAPSFLSGSRNCYLSLASSIGSISLALGSLMQIPNITDRISLQRGFFLTSLGFIYFVSLTSFCNKYLLESKRGKEFRKKYRLMLSDVMEITNKIVSAIQAFFSFLVGLLVCKTTCAKSFVYASHYLMEAYGWFGTAYFMYDIWSMYRVHTQKIADKLKLMRIKSSASLNNAIGQINGDAVLCSPNNTGGSTETNVVVATPNSNIGDNTEIVNRLQNLDLQEVDSYDYGTDGVQLAKNGSRGFLKYVLTHPIMMIHHIFIGTFGLLVVTYIRGGGHCIYSYMYMMEFSTPFVSLRSILATMHLKDTQFYIINGLTMLGTFLVFRVLMWPYVMWRYSVAINCTFWQAMTSLPIGCIISISILFLPQIYWFSLMVKGAFKVLASKKKPNNEPSSITKEMKLYQKQLKNNNISPNSEISPLYTQTMKVPTDTNIKTSMSA